MTNISDLRPDPKNARRHPERNVRALLTSLQEVGAARSIVIDENNVILAGNATVEAAGQVGIENVQIVEVDGNTIVAVKRTGLTPAQKTRLAILDNRTGELAQWDAGIIGELLDDGVKLDDLFFPEELSKILDSFQVPDFEPVGIEEQGRLDEKAKCTCPECGHVFTP